MATEIKVPTLGESVTSATVARWIKQPGEAVAIDEPLVELETDKVTVEVNAPIAGVLTAISVPEGTEVEVGAVLGVVDPAAAQTVAWVDDLLSLSNSNNSSAALVDPTTAILNSAYGQKSSAANADPTTGILDSAYGDSSNGSTAGTSNNGAAAGALESSAVSSGNAGSGSSVNVYA